MTARTSGTCHIHPLMMPPQLNGPVYGPPGLGILYVYIHLLDSQ